MPAGKAVILLWMTGGPSQIDTWDPKPDRPLQNRGPFGVISTKLPGVLICEHLPKQAAMLDRFTIIRSVDARHSNHEPNKVFQTGHLDAAPRINPAGEMYPAIGSVVARYHGPNQPSMPPYVAFQTSRSHIADGGYLGQQYDPFIANRAARLPIYTNVGKDTGRQTEAEFFRLPAGLTHERLQDRRSLLSGSRPAARLELDRSAGDRRDGPSCPGRRSTCWSAAGPSKPSTCRGSRRGSATDTASTSGASRPSWPGGWSRRGSRS